MSNYLDIDAIENASELLNSTLQSKGYISTPLLFNSINWNDLVTDDNLKNLEITEEIYNNDKNFINIIYSLQKSIERHQSQSKSFNKMIMSKDSKIESLSKQVESLQAKLNDLQLKNNQFEAIDKNQLQIKINDLNKLNKLQNNDLVKLKNWCNDLKIKYNVELKRKNIEISQLKNQILENRKLSNTDINSNLILDNDPIIDNSGPQQDSSNAVIEQHEDILNQLTDLITKLMKENSKFSKFIKILNEYISNLNLQIFNKNSQNLNLINLTNPSKIIDLNQIVNDDSDELESFEILSKPLINNVYKNFHYLNDLINSIDSQIDSTSSDPTISKLRQENDILYSNWQSAIKALEDWKSYEQFKSN